MQIPSAVEEVVGAKWAPEDLMPLNGTPAEVQELRERMMQQRAAVKSKKDKKKVAKISAAAVEAAIASAAADALPNSSNGAANGAHVATNGEMHYLCSCGKSVKVNTLLHMTCRSFKHLCCLGKCFLLGCNQMNPDADLLCSKGAAFGRRHPALHHASCVTPES